MERSTRLLQASIGYLVQITLRSTGLDHLQQQV